jgi:hypothetical protein
MNRKIALFGAALVALVAITGFATAAGSGALPADTTAVDAGFGPGDGPTDGTGPVNATTADRPMNGTNSPWVTGDERLDLIQERFDLTDEQMNEIQTEVQSLVDEGASQDEIRSTVTEMLESYGVEDPTLGPAADGSTGMAGGGYGAGAGGQGQGPADGTGSGSSAGAGGYGGGSGPHGPADGSCLD